MAKSTGTLDGYTLTDKLRKTRRRHNLSAATQALYYELVAICNEEGWVDEFRCSNDELCFALRITEKSLVDYRLNLIQAGLLNYQSGKSKKQIGAYSFIGCKIFSQSGSQKDSQSGSQKDSQSGSQLVEKASDNYKDKTKTEFKPNQTKHSSSGDKPPGNKKNECSTIHWKAIVDTWFKFYKNNFTIDPTFNGQAAKNLKLIIERLEKLSKEKSYEWTEEYAVKVFSHFLSKAITDSWIKQNFLLSNLYSKFDTIVNPKNDGTAKNKQSGGAEVSTASAFRKIDSMPSPHGAS